MLVVDIDALAAVHVLNLANQVLLYGLFARDSQNVVRHQWAVNERVTRLHVVARVDAGVLVLRDQVLVLDTALVANDNRTLAALLLFENLDHAVDFGDDGRVLRLAGLEDLRDARQTTGDVLRSTCLSWRLGDDGAWRDRLAFFDFEVSLLGHVVEVENLTVLGVFDHDLRMQVTLMLHDRVANVAAGIALGANRFAFNEILEADLTTRFGENRNRVRVPFAQYVALLDPRLVFELNRRTGRHFILVDFASLLVDQRNLAVARQHNSLTFCIDDGLEPRVFDDAVLRGLDVALFNITLGDTTDVERPHRKLGAGLADTLGGNDTDGHAFLDHRSGRHVHTVAASAEPQRRLAGHGTADLDPFETKFLDLAGDFAGDHLILRDNHFRR